MAKIVITIDARDYTEEQLNDLVKNFSLATGWSEKTVAPQKDENGDIILGEDQIPLFQVDENGDPLLENNPETALAFSAKPIAAYLRKTVVNYLSLKASEVAKTQASQAVNSQLDAISVSVGIV